MALTQLLVSFTGVFLVLRISFEVMFLLMFFSLLKSLILNSCHVPYSQQSHRQEDQNALTTGLEMMTLLSPRGQKTYSK